MHGKRFIFILFKPPAREISMIGELFTNGCLSDHNAFPKVQK